MNSGLSPNRDDLTNEYATDEIVVEWQPRLCIHSGNCVRALPAVFDDSRRPWVQVDAATADEVEAAVALCPSGALRARRHGASGVSHGEAPEVRASPGGPLLVSGGVRVTGAAGNVSLTLCPFIAHYIESRPEFDDLVASDYRDRPAKPRA